MNDNSSRLFDKPGYISIKEYVEDIQYLRKNGPWELPLGVMDRVHIFFLSLILRVSWFSDALYLLHPYEWSPAYSILFSFLQKKKIVDFAIEKESYSSEYVHFFAKKSIFVNEYDVPLTGQGIAKEKSEAFSKVLGEMIERMVSGLFDMNKNILYKSPNEMRGIYEIVYPPKYHRFLDIQKENYRELTHDPAHSIEWVKGTNLITDTSVYVPRQMTSWFGFGSARVFREKLLDANSNGCAGYFTKEGAVLRGLLEVVHRDGFLVHWLTLIPPTRIDPDTLPEEMQKIIQEFKSRGISLSILNITSLSIPSVYIAAINEKSETPRIVLSGASAVTFKQAIRDALKEMVAMSEVFSYISEEGIQVRNEGPVVTPFISDINKTTRQTYWRGVEKVKQFQWFISGEKISYNDVCIRDLLCAEDDSSQLKKCLEVLSARGEEYYPVVYYPENRIQEELGFYVAQVYIPKAFPLYLNECYGTFDSDRLQEFARSKNNKDWGLNPLPHMFS